MLLFVCRLFCGKFLFLFDKMLRVTVLLLCLCYFATAEVGDRCTRQGASGTCVLLSKCQAAIDSLKKNRVFPQICSFVGTEPVVCCAGYGPAPTVRPPPPPTRPIPPPPTPTPSEDAECPPVPDEWTLPKTGQKALDKCLEYQGQLVYPCRKSVALIGGMERVNRCHHNADGLIIGGVNADANEFPHMVLLGFGTDIESAQWSCGGSLISDQFVLTAGHCTSNRYLDSVKFAFMGSLKRSDPKDPEKVRRISRIIPHPQYKAPSRYHDIALLKLEFPVTLSEYLVPACLHVASNVDLPERALASGWGHTTNKMQGSESDVLQKVTLNKYDVGECADHYHEHRTLKQGYDNVTMICYGDPTKDTCQGDSGGPLQFNHNRIHCMYTLIGVTSFGTECAIGYPGVYTRVSNYVSWIEREVWP